MTGLAVATGPVIGGALVTGLGWRWIFLVNIPVGVFVFVLALLRVDESRDPEPKRLDLVGFITFSTGLFALIFGLIRSNHDGWSSPIVIGSLVAAAVLLGAFTAAELLRRDPMFDFKLLRVPTFDGGLIAAFAISASIFSVLTYLILWVQGLLGLLGSAGRRPLPAAVAVHILHRRDRGTAHLLRAHPASHRARVRADRGRAAAHARPDRHVRLDAPGARHDRLRGGSRTGERASGRDGGGRGGAAACRHGLRHQLHLPAGRHSDRHRGPRDHLRQPYPLEHGRGPGRDPGGQLRRRR